jgi:hypothetical protein
MRTYVGGDKYGWGIIGTRLYGMIARRKVSEFPVMSFW